MHGGMSFEGGITVHLVLPILPLVRMSRLFGAIHETREGNTPHHHHKIGQERKLELVGLIERLHAG